MFIQTEQTPNPNAMKFVPEQTVLKDGTAEFRSLEEAAPSPLAQALLKLDGVEGVFLSTGFISVNKTDEVEWDILRSDVISTIMDHFLSGQPVMLETTTDQTAERQNTAHAEDEDEITLQIKELLDTRVRPAVAQDGGDIVFDRFEDGTVYLFMKGACAGCPSSTMTLKMGIENLLKHFIPEVQDVRPAEETPA